MDTLSNSSPQTDDGSGAPSSPTPETTDTATDSSTSAETSTQIVQTPPPTATAVPTETWTQPATPRAPENKKENRISSVTFVNTENASSGSGYTSFDVQVTATTTMKDMDPTPSVDGEPYFVVEINDKVVTRSDANFRDNGTFTLTVRPGALEQFDSGTLDVRVALYDEDHKHDDLYDEWTGTINYAA